MLRSIRKSRNLAASLGLFDCFTANFNLCHNKQLLDNPNQFLGQKPLADIYCSFQKEALSLEIKCFVPFTKSFLNQFRRADCFELFIHTRFDPLTPCHNLFCHHFLFLPDFEGHPVAKEMTCFRGGQVRSLAKKTDLFMDRSFFEDGYNLEISLNADALHGYDPHEYKNFGFFYRLHTSEGRQTFFVSDSSNLDYAVHLWPHIHLVN